MTAISDRIESNSCTPTFSPSKSPRLAASESTQDLCFFELEVNSAIADLASLESSLTLQSPPTPPLNTMSSTHLIDGFVEVIHADTDYLDEEESLYSTDGSSVNFSDDESEVEGDNVTPAQSTIVVDSTELSDEDSAAEQEEATPAQSTVVVEVSESLAAVNTNNPKDTPATYEYLDFVPEISTFNNINLVHDFHGDAAVNALEGLIVDPAEHLELKLHLPIKESVYSKRQIRILYVAVDHEKIEEVLKHIELTLKYGLDKSEMSDVTVSGFECITAFRHKDSTYSLVLGGEQGRVYIADGKLSMEGKPIDSPDIAIFLHPAPADDSDESSTAKLLENRYIYTRQAMLKSRIPVLDLSEDGPLSIVAPLTYTKSSHAMSLNIESVTADGEARAFGEVTPVNCENFLKIAPHLLNAHLACITQGPSQHRRVSSATKKEVEPQTLSTRESAGGVRKVLGRKWQQLNTAYGHTAKKSGLGLLIVIGCLFVSWLAQAGPVVNIAASKSISQAIVHLEQPTAWFPGFGLSSSKSVLKPCVSITSPASNFATPVSIRTPVDKKTDTSLIVIAGKALSKMVPDTEPTNPRDSPVAFVLEAVEGNKIKLTPNSTIRTNRKGIEVTVKRNGLTINSQLKHGANGALLVELDPSDAYGILNVTVRGPKKHVHTAKIDLGSGWYKCLSKDLIVARSNAYAIAHRMSTSLSVLVNETVTPMVKMTTNLSLWSPKLDSKPPANDVKFKVMSIPGRLSRAAESAQGTAVAIYHDILTTIPSTKVTPSLPSEKDYARGKNNAKDLLTAIGIHSSNIMNGCTNEYKQAGWKGCGVGCAQRRKNACEERKAKRAGLTPSIGQKVGIS
ncbi:hypothetical protein EJ08DRAFT_130897 [Tothia fuscella]|uniref:Uncharacterized protein n=1 Tax=Tothia fuscella TaxID=1048955 RepID=A0A9P4U0E7_9PEZI|nr:hypothetical protein EJ08DRAFT_130897 [Tothia fuscella]